MEKTRVSIISYLNSKPFLYGLQNHPVINDIALSLDIPSRTVAKLAFNQADVGLVPVGGLDDLDNYTIFSDYCIGAVGKVRTVVLASEVPVEQIETVLMDYQSRSSVLLAKVLAKFYWKKEFNWENTCNNFQNVSIQGKTAGVVIGDRVFEVEKRLPYCYDLSETWMKFTGLPFVFAVWATTRKLPKEFEKQFNNALELGVTSLDEVARLEKEKHPGVDINDYFTNNINYSLDEKKRAGMKKFLELAKKLEPVELA